MEARNEDGEEQTESQTVGRHKRVNGKDRKKADRQQNEQGYSQWCQREGWKPQPPARRREGRCMTNVCHQDESSL